MLHFTKEYRYVNLLTPKKNKKIVMINKKQERKTPPIIIYGIIFQLANAQPERIIIIKKKNKNKTKNVELD